MIQDQHKSVVASGKVGRGQFDDAPRHNIVIKMTIDLSNILAIRRDDLQAKYCIGQAFLRLVLPTRSKPVFAELVARVLLPGRSNAHRCHTELMRLS